MSVLLKHVIKSINEFLLDTYLLKNVCELSDLLLLDMLAQNIWVKYVAPTSVTIHTLMTTNHFAPIWHT